MDAKSDKKYWDEVRLRNLKINIAKKQLDDSMLNKKSYSVEDLKNLFAFKEYDINFWAQSIFNTSNGNYCFNDSFIDFLNNVQKSHKAVKDQLPEAEAFFIGTFGPFLDEMESTSYTMCHSTFPGIFEKLKKCIPIIHWGKLPIFNKHLLYNRNLDPEINTMQFYDHPDCLKALLNEIRDNGIFLTNQSDLSLNKVIHFNIYNRRWGHPDFYCISRTMTGWICSSMFARSEECDKDGTYFFDSDSSSESKTDDINGPLFESLEHDSVFFPKDGVQYALRKLWDDADDGKIDIGELTKRMQELADWISAVERVVGETQPKWVDYY